MNTQDPDSEQISSATSNTNDLSPGANGADDLGNDDLNNIILRQPAVMSPEAKEDRCTEIQKEIHKLEREIVINTAQCKHHFIKSGSYDHRYRRFRKRMEDTTPPLILDTSNEVQLQQITMLVTLDTKRARALSGATKALRRELEIVQELKGHFLELAWLKGAVGTPEYQEALDDILDKIDGQNETRREMGRRLLVTIRRNGGT